MAKTFFNEPFVYGHDATLLPFRWKKFHNDEFLVTTDQGSWAILNLDEFNSLKSQKFDKDLFKVLDEKGIILTKHNLSRIEGAYKDRFSFLFSGASLHIIVPTLRCNQKCIYCHSSVVSCKDDKYDMDKKTAKKVLEYIFQTPADRITIEFQGGDALLTIDLFKYIVLEAKKMNILYQKTIRFALVTNLTLMTDDVAEFVKNNNVDVCTSLDGPDYVHDKNRALEGGKPTHKIVLSWIKKLSVEYGKTVGALMVTTKHSLSYPKEIINEYVKLGITDIQIKYLNKLGVAEKTWKKIGYGADDFLIFWKKCLDHIIYLNKKGIKIRERYVTLALRKILLTTDPSFLDFRSPCGIVCGQQAYDYNGDIFSCDEGRNNDMFKLGNVSTHTYKNVVVSDKAQNLIASSMCENYLCDSCAYKPWCGLCPVMAYAEQGNIVPKLSSFSKCVFHKFVFDYVFSKLKDVAVREIFFDWCFDWKRSVSGGETLDKCT